ncbi:MAG: hypothetical protein IKK17_05795 [Oscillospiraceae bacterium]|nr:hypothetical protein [Oscillospiraceae bacterium]
MADVDWLVIKMEYITTDLSLRVLAEKHGVSRTTIGHRSKTEGWVEARRQHRLKIETKTSEKIANKEANKLARLAATADKALDVVVKAFDDPDQFNRYIVETTEEYAVPEITEEEDGDSHAVGMRRWSHEERFAKVDTKALKDLTTVLKDLTGLMRNLYGIPTQAEAEAQRIAAERLKLEQQKSASAAEDTGRIEVVFAAGEDAWNE